ncbi:MAG: ATP-binding protein [Chloroflexota bacterium]
MALALPEINAPRCTSCGSCIDACHADALAMGIEGAMVTEPEQCDYCTACEVVCPADAIACPFELVIEG